MKVAFDVTIPLDGENTGIAVMVCHLVRHVSQIAAQDEFEIYLSRTALGQPILPHARNISYVPVEWSRSLASRLLWELFRLPRLAKRRGIDVLCAPSNFYLPLHIAVPTVLVVCDMSFVHSPTSYSRVQRLYYDSRLRLSLRSASVVVTISESTKMALLAYCGRVRTPIIAIPLGVPSPDFGGQPALQASNLHTLDLPGRFVLTVGTHPRKNVGLIVRAVERLRTDPQFADLRLVVVGPECFVPPNWRRGTEARDYSCSTIYLGFVPPSALPTLYRGASAYITASSDEGFGLTILEAMSYGTPVICSDIPAHREVAGESAQFFDPGSENSLVQRLKTVLSNPVLRERLVAMGRENLKRFSWDACAQSYIALFRSLVS